MTLYGLSRRMGGHLTALGSQGAPDDAAAGSRRVLVRVADGQPWDLNGTSWVPITRGVHRDAAGERIRFDSAGGSGITQLWERPSGWQVTSWWNPGPKEQLAASVLRSRQRLLEAQLLLHYPALVSAAAEGYAPLHVSLVSVGGATVALAGPGGVGKSTLVSGAVADGAVAWCDNVAVSDGWRCAGLREPMRVPAEIVEGAGGAHTTHGRVEIGHDFPSDTVEPDAIVVVTRGTQSEPMVRACSAARARRALVAGTFAAGELSRLWPLVASLSLGWDDVPAVPEVQRVATDLSHRVPAFELVLGRCRGVSLSQLLTPVLARTEQGVVR